MKKAIIYSTVIIINVFIFSGCSNNKITEINELTDTVNKITDETEALLTFFEQTGNFINQREIPTMVKVDNVFDNLNTYHLIDLRNHDDYTEGHIDGAVNVEWGNLFNYMKNENCASRYKKIVFICYSNHMASYATMMFRLLGYDNVYSMNWGMSSCDFNTMNSKWGKAISNKYANQLETTENPKGDKNPYPKINTGKSLAYDILETRVQELLINHKFKIRADNVFEDPGKYYIICYWPEEDYKKGHIPGSIQYTPKESLTRDTYLATLPTNKPIVVYDYTGQHAAFIAAYLQILGYDAYALGFGANSFMHDKLISSGIGHAFNKSIDFKEYPLTKGELPSTKTVLTKSDNDGEKEDNTPVIPIINKKEKKEEGGC